MISSFIVYNMISRIALWSQTDPRESRGYRCERHLLSGDAPCQTPQSSQSPPRPPTALVPSAQATANLVAVPSTARRLAEAGVSPNTRRAYTGALRRLDTSRAELAARRGEAFSAAAPVTEAELVWYLTDLWEDGRAPASAVLVVAAARFRARLLGYPDPVGPEIERIMAGYRREGADWGRGQAAPLTAEGLAAILATCHQPRRSARGTESAGVAHRPGGWSTPPWQACCFTGGCAVVKPPRSRGAM